MQKGNLCEFVTNRIWNCIIAFQKKNIRHTYLNHNKASQKSSFLFHSHSMAHFQGGQAQIPSKFWWGELLHTFFFPCFHLTSDVVVLGSDPVQLNSLVISWFSKYGFVSKINLGQRMNIVFFKFIPLMQNVWIKKLLTSHSPSLNPSSPNHSQLTTYKFNTQNYPKWMTSAPMTKNGKFITFSIICSRRFYANKFRVNNSSNKIRF